MFTHKKCGKEVTAKSIVHEYAPITSMDSGCIETGDVDDSSIEEVSIWCENCCKVVQASEVDADD